MIDMSPQTSKNPLHVRQQDSSRLIFENKIGGDFLMKYHEAAQFLGISETHLRRLKAKGAIRFVPIGIRGIRFRKSHLDQWIEENQI